MNNDTIIIERFSKKRYETYRKKGVPFHVVNGEGHLCEVKAFDCGEGEDKAFVEATSVYQGKNMKDAHYVPLARRVFAVYLPRPMVRVQRACSDHQRLCYGAKHFLLARRQTQREGIF